MPTRAASGGGLRCAARSCRVGNLSRLLEIVTRASLRGLLLLLLLLLPLPLFVAWWWSGCSVCRLEGAAFVVARPSRVAGVRVLARVL